MLEPISKIDVNAASADLAALFGCEDAISPKKYMSIPRPRIALLARKVLASPTGLFLRWVPNRFIISVGAGWLFLMLLAVPLSVNAEVRPIVFPVSGPSIFSDDFNATSGVGVRLHRAIDIVADKMTPVVAAVDGVVSYVISPEASWGYSIGIRDAEGYQYNYLHLNNDTPGTDDGLGGEANAYAPGIQRGVSVVKGELLGWVGDSGNAENTVPHLHFEIHDPERTAINPYESLRAVASGDVAVFTQDISISKVVIAIPKDYILIKYANDPTIFLLSKNIKYRILNTTTLNVLGKSASDARVIPDNEQYPTGSSISIASPTTTSHPSTGEENINPTEPLPELSLGSGGQAVVELQTALKNLGYFTSTITNYFGPITKAAVIKFQLAKGIDPIGIVGPKTRVALGLNNMAAAPRAGAPIVQSGLEFRIFSTAVTVIGSVNPNGSLTKYWYEYGESPTLGTSTASREIGSGIVSTSTGYYVTGLYPSTTYHIRLTAENQFGITRNMGYAFQTSDPQN